MHNLQEISTVIALVRSGLGPLFPNGKMDAIVFWLLRTGRCGRAVGY